MEQQLIYDGSISGYFTAVFEVYERRIERVKIQKKSLFHKGLFDEPLLVITDEQKAKRVIEGLHAKLPAGVFEMVKKVLHSEVEESEEVILSVIRSSFSEPKGLRMDYRNPSILRMRQIHKMMTREIHRMHAFVRFQKTVDDIYAATISPDFDVIPFIGKHFEKRYADQHWMIYDTKRDYGLFFDQKGLQTITLKNANWVSQHQISSYILAEEEAFFKKAWTDYFHATCISERKNMRLHLQHVPHRYWKYLPEKRATRANHLSGV